MMSVSASVAYGGRPGALRKDRIGRQVGRRKTFAVGSVFSLLLLTGYRYIQLRSTPYVFLLYTRIEHRPRTHSGMLMLLSFFVPGHSSRKCRQDPLLRNVSLALRLNALFVGTLQVFLKRFMLVWAFFNRIIS